MIVFRVINYHYTRWVQSTSNTHKIYNLPQNVFYDLKKDPVLDRHHHNQARNVWSKYHEIDLNIS